MTELQEELEIAILNNNQVAVDTIEKQITELLKCQ